MKKLSTIFAITAAAVLLIGSLALAAEVPEEFSQAPELKGRVESGELPPVQERLPEKPYVVDPIDEVGEYGGTLRTTTLAAEAYGDDTMLHSWPNLVKATPDGSGFMPHLAQDWEISEDASTYTFHLIEGVKWSDGEPFTVDDIMFWYEDYLKNKELMPVIGDPWKTEEGLVEINKIDDYTVEFKFPVPRPFFLNRLVHMGAWNLIFPEHYMKQFHVDYRDKEELVQEAKEAGYDHWYQYFNNKNTNIWGQSIRKNRPTLTSYVLETKSSDRRVWKRNPYFWKVDTAGNQLPYIDRIVTEIVTDKEVVQGMIMSGEVDFAGITTDIRNYPMYKQYEKEGEYRTLLWKTGMGSDVIYMVNQTHKDPQLREVFQKAKFRKALSYAIDRNEINNSIYFGKAEPRQYTVLESSKYYEPEFAESYIEHNPDKARELLDEIGLKDQDGDGWRDLPNGDDFNFTLEFVSVETPKAPNAELVVQHWQNVGLNVNSKAISGELSGQRAPANMMDANLWHGDKATDVLFPTQPQFFVPQSPGWERTIWPQWGRYLSTDGNAGEEPPAKVKELYNTWEQMITEPNKEKRIELGKKIVKMQAENLWVIGTVGEAPAPVIVDKRLKNVPETGLFVWDTLYSMRYDPEQFFFDQE